ncbi:DUF3316 domain-containing protein [Vibrio jasicida]|uniref:DUF3316 domain-containing protein n=1 Tax=Vibrio jasicida TaxID=766224 RepID=UPI000CE426C3|nr:DUF3316 domain-containing protein [Vibrio jasicida]
MKRLISLVSLIVLTATPVAAFAGGYQWTNNSKTIQGNVVDSKQVAYDMGFEMIKNYQSKSSKELRDEFKSAFDMVDRQSFSITNAKVTVDEFLQDNGQIAYQPILNVKYEYRMREPGNR